MANDKYYGYTPKTKKPSDKQGQIYAGLEKGKTYENLGNSLDRVHPYEFRRGMDYELNKMGISRLAESTPEDREKSTETVIKNLDKHPAYYSALIQFEVGMHQGSKIVETSFNTFLDSFTSERGDGMVEVDKEIKDDKMVEPKYTKTDYTIPMKTIQPLKEAIKNEIRSVLSEQDDDEDLIAKKATKGAKKSAKGMARFDKEEKAISELLFGKEKEGEEVSEENPGKGSLLFLKDKHLEAYKKDKNVEKYKKSIQLSDIIVKKLQKHVDIYSKLGNNITINDVKGKDLPDTIKKLEARKTAIAKERQDAIADVGRQRNEIASTDMTRANHLRLLEIIRENGISLREGAASIKTYYEIAKTAYLEGLSKGLKL